MKKLFPEAPDVPQNVANRAVRIIEKHLRLHRVTRARDLPEEAKVRLYRDLRFFFDSGLQPPSMGGEKRGFSVRGFFSGLWEKIENFLSMSEGCRGCGTVTVFTWMSFGESARLTVVPWSNCPRGCGESG